jgi:hypothetical protein
MAAYWNKRRLNRLTPLGIVGILAALAMALIASGYI